MKALKVKVSGSYLKDKNSKDYDMFVYIPVCPDNWVQLNVMRRAVPMELYRTGNSCDYLRSCYVDSVEEVELEKDTPKEVAGKIKEVNSYVGKDIKEMTHEEIQFAAMGLQLLGVQLYRQTDLRECRQRLYKIYSEEFLGKELEEGFDYAAASPLEIGSEVKPKKVKKSKSNKEILDEIERESE